MRKYNEVIIYDLEFTCENVKTEGFKPEIIEIGMVKLVNGNVVGTFHRLLKPTKRLSKSCIEITGITEEDVKNGDNLVDIIVELEAFVGDLDMFSWGKEDKGVFLSQLNEFNLSNTSFYRQIYNQSFDIMRDFMKMRKVTYKVGQDKALRICNVEQLGTRHRALPDALNLCNIFLFIQNRGHKIEPITKVVTY